MWAGPSTAYDILGTLMDGEELTIIDKNGTRSSYEPTIIGRNDAGDWLLVYLPLTPKGEPTEGWVSVFDLLLVNVEVAQLPVIQGPPTPTPISSPTATPSATPIPIPTPQELIGKIAFLSDRDGGEQVFIMDPDGGNQTRLADRSVYETALERDAYSADQRYQAFVKKPLGGRRAPTIFFYDYEYQVEQTVTAMGSGITYAPAWSPVSDEIAFVATVTGNDEIWVINRDGTGERQLTYNDWEWDKHPSWSPDSSQIVFWSNRVTGRKQIWFMNADGSDQRNLSGNPYNDWDPVWIKY